MKRIFAPSAQYLPLDFELPTLSGTRTRSPVPQKAPSHRIRLLCDGSGLGPFAGFLRKWIIHGHTYATSDIGLLERIWWNRQCSYDLDALVYLAKLMRRRFDSLWRAQGAPTSGLPTIDLAAEPEGLFSIQSYTDGALTAVSSRGHPVRWTAETGELLAGTELKLTLEGRCLTHRLAESYIRRYRHGPYVRRLVLRRMNVDQDLPLYVLIGCFRGWRPEDRKDVSPQVQQERSPRLFALALRPKHVDGEVRELVIQSLRTVDLCDELYGLHPLDTDAIDSTLRILAGTRGSWEEDQASGEVRSPAPFIEIAIKIGRRAELTIGRPAISPIVSEQGQRMIFRRDELLAENPCWCLVTVSIGDACWLWAGFEDGRLRCYKRLASGWTENPLSAGFDGTAWVEGGGYGRRYDLEEREDVPQDRSILCSAAVRQVLAIQDPQRGGMSLLAYGTADGVVGLVSLEALEAREHKPWVHWLHSKEQAPICGLISYQEEDGPRLLTVSQDGYATIYHLQNPPREPPSRRFNFLGSWQDRFPLHYTARAVTTVKSSEPIYQQAFEGCEMPTLLVGSGGGEVYKHCLALPRGTVRRRRAVKHWLRESFRREKQQSRSQSGSDTTPTLVYSIAIAEGESGDRECYAWLRMLDTGGSDSAIAAPEMLRLAFWLEMDQEGRELERVLATPAQQPAAGVSGQAVERYLEVIGDLADEAYSRRPYGRDSAKIIWEEASKVANRMASQALEDHERTAFLLETCIRINVKIDDLCNKWIGSQQALEARVLIHSFNVLFDWSDIALIAWIAPPEPAAGQLLEFRRFMLLKALQRRLSYSEAMVQLETLRVLNRAMRWAIVAVRNHRPGLRMGLRSGDQLPERSNSHLEGHRDLGFYDLMTLVGDLAKRHHDSLSPADPLTTEIAHFFSLSMLLVPDCALIVGHTMSESRLLDRGPEISEMITKQVGNLVRQLNLEPKSQAALEKGIPRFEAYCSPEIHFRTQAAYNPAWWQLMTLGEAPRHSGDTLTDGGVLYEQHRALHAARALAELQIDPRPGSAEETGMRWLDEESRDQVYLRHSHKFLCHLRAVRERIMEVLEKDMATFLREEMAPLGPRATEICEQALEGLEASDLHEPQRTHYREIIFAWRDHIERRAQRAVAVLDAIDRFNRHIYRTSADNFMTTVLELVMQVAPLPPLLPPGAKQPLRHQIEEALKDHHPLLRQIFQSGTELVEQTHLAGTLLAAARNILREPSDVDGHRWIPPYEVRLDDIFKEIENAAERFKFEVKPSHQDFSSSVEAPGNRAIWRTVIFEWANNVDRHAGEQFSPVGGRRTEIRLLRVAYTTEVEREVQRRVVLLSGTMPFSETLTEERAKELASIRSRSGEKAAAGWLLGLAAKAQQPRQEPKIGAHSVAGMGMFLIRIICELVGLRAAVSLCDLGAELAGREDPSPERLQQPLCLEISWPVDQKEVR